MRVIYKSPEKTILDALYDAINESIAEEIKKEDKKKENKNTEDEYIFVPTEAVAFGRYDPKTLKPLPTVKRILFRDPATIVWFSDGTKSVAICGYDDTYDRETGVAICLCKRMLGNKEYRELMDEWCYKKENLN
jgi:hypothetical protein